MKLLIHNYLSSWWWQFRGIAQILKFSNPMMQWKKCANHRPWRHLTYKEFIWPFSTDKKKSVPFIGLIQCFLLVFASSFIYFYTCAINTPFSPLYILKLLFLKCSEFHLFAWSHNFAQLSCLSSQFHNMCHFISGNVIKSSKKNLLYMFTEKWKPHKNKK